MEPTPTIVDRIAKGLTAALVLVGVVGLGILEILAGQPYGAAPATNDAGEVIATPAVDPTLRTGLVIAALLVLALYGAYRLATPDAGGEDGPTERLTTAH